MKRWNAAEMIAMGQKLYTTLHKRKTHAHHDHEIHLMAREIDEWLPQGVQAMVEGHYTPRHLQRIHFKDETIDQLHLSDRIFQHILLKQLKPTLPYIMNQNC